MDGITISVGAISAIGGILGTWLKMRQPALPQPCKTEKSDADKLWLENEREHEDLFRRVGKVEQKVAAVVERDNAQDRLIDRMAGQVEKLYDRIVLGVKNK